MIDYLLGRLPEDRQTGLEARLLADDTCFEELLVIEEDLRDAYARNELPSADREIFERRLLSTPQHRQKQQFAQSLVHLRSSATSVPRTGRRLWQAIQATMRARPFLVPAFSVGLIVLLALGVWMARRSTIPEPGVARITNHAVSPGSQASPIDTQHPPEHQIAQLVLTSDLTRSIGKELPTLVIPSGANELRLRAQVIGHYPQYEGSIQTVEGKSITHHLRPESLRPGYVNFLLPTTLLSPGDYVLTIAGLPANGRSETSAEYAFRVVRR